MFSRDNFTVHVGVCEQYCIVILSRNKSFPRNPFEFLHIRESLVSRSSRLETRDSILATRSFRASRLEDRVSRFEFRVSTYFWAVLYFDHCNTDAVLYQLSYQAICELVILWVRNIFFSPLRDSPSRCRLILSPPTRTKTSGTQISRWWSILLLTELSRSVWKNLDRGRKYRPNARTI